MSLDLDRRQRAMLAEMGVHVWLPLADTATEHTSTAAATPAPRAEPSRQPHAPAHTPAHPSALNPATTAPPEQAAMPVAATAITDPAAVPAASAGTMANAAARSPAPTTTRSNLPAPTDSADWSALRDAVNTCQACPMSRGRLGCVLATLNADQHADWLVLGDAPDDAQERAGHPFAGDAGLLLDQMLRAVGVYRAGVPQADTAAHRAHLSLALKCRPTVPRAPDAAALQACAQHLQREIALTQPKVMLAMGRLAMQVLLSQEHPQDIQLPLGQLRGRLWHYQGVPVVVTYPPTYLLRNGQDKALAWQDLCLAADSLSASLKPAAPPHDPDRVA